LPKQGKTTSDRDWLVKHLNPLIDAGKDLLSKTASQIVKVPTYDKGYWTGLKLILEKYYIKPYLNILGSRGNLAYVDLFAGPGLNLIGDQKVPVPGSPIIPIMIKESEYQFSKFIFSELNRDYFNALAKRLALFPEVKNITEVLNKDANLVIQGISDILNSNNISHSLVFVDPEGMELEWTSLENLVDSIDCDLIINFPSAGINRNLHNPPVLPKIKKFLGPGAENIPQNADEQWAIEVYRRNLASIGKDVSTEIIVKSGNAFHYHLIPAVRTTAGGSPWFRLFLDAKRRIEKFTGNILGIIADQIEGRATALDNETKS